MLEGKTENVPLISRGGGQAAARGSDNGAMGDDGGEHRPQWAPSAVATRPPVAPPPLRPPPSSAAEMASDGQRQDCVQQQQPVVSSQQLFSPPSSSIYFTSSASQLLPPQQPNQRGVNFDMNSASLPNPTQFNTDSHEFHDNETFEGSEDTPTQMGGQTVTCRVCETEIGIEGKANQHVVRCLQCNEVTPIRAAPPGKKYVRCPCNCLLVCKATSTRIACPRPNCRRVITLVNGPPNSGVPGTAIRAPVGTCRVQCAYCQDIFMFNTLTNQLAICPHCRKSSSVGASYTRSRSLLYFVVFLISSLFLIGVFVAITHGNNSFFMYAFMAILLFACAFLAYRFVFFARIKVSQVLGPL
ncbi:hypothetical protein niasHT_000256 [Heterodera trifolii]